MRNMSEQVSRVIHFYGFNVIDDGSVVCVSSPNGEIIFRRVNNTYYMLYSAGRPKVSVTKLIEMLEEL